MGDEVLQESAAVALEFEISAINRAISQTKAVESEDGSVMLRLNRHAKAEAVVNALAEAPALLEVRNHVLDAKCELRPAWAHGAWVLMPMTREIFAEGMVSPEELSHEHILMLRKDEQAVREALKEVPKAIRPQLSLAKLKCQAIERDR